MPAFKVISNQKVSYKPDKNDLAGAIWRLMHRDGEFAKSKHLGIWNQSHHEELKKLVFLEVRFFNELAKERKDTCTLEEAEAEFKSATAITQMFQYITPCELLQMFPISKTYDGDGDWKDYFTTIKAVSEFGMDTPLENEENVLNLLWGYQNFDIDMLNVNVMMAISRLKQAQGGKSPMEEFLEDKGVPTYTYHEKEGYLYNRKTGETTKVEPAKKRIPKFFKIVAGEKTAE